MTANAGYHVYNTGDVLTSAQVQYNLQNQTVMYFATTTARDAALTGAILVEGMVSYTPATGLMYYNGSAWTAVGGSSVPTSYGFTAGKNSIINGNFGVWQRGTSATPVSGYGFGPDRFQTYSFGTSTSTISQQSFSPGAAPVSGYESAYFCRLTSTNSNTFLEYRVEDVRTLAGQTATLSFWAKSASSQTITSNVYQNFGSGGSSTVQVVTSSPVSITTSWVRYTVPITFPSLNGKTIGSGSYLILNWYGAINNNLDFWGVQLEAGSSATSFQTATGTLQGELAACQRYYWRNTAGGSYSRYALGIGSSSNQAWFQVYNPVVMRVSPTSVDYANLRVDDTGSGVAVTALGFTGDGANPYTCNVYASVSSGTTQFRPYILENNNNSTGYIGMSAEL
jgi:hypothetical protein